MKLFNDEETHPSFGMMGFTRVTFGGEGAVLHGSDIKHNTVIEMNLYHSSKKRGLNKDWHHADQTIAKVQMSQNQFATMITSMNMGDGIPVTLAMTETDGRLPAPEFNSVLELNKNEFKAKASEVANDTKILMASMKDILSGSGTVKKADRETLIKLTEKVVREIDSNMPYMQETFAETMDDIVTDAKGTIEAFYQQRVIETGLAAISSETVIPAPKMIDSK